MAGRLRLEDCLEDSPQTRALVGLYEKDSDMLLEYAQSLNSACHRIAQAQNEFTLAIQSLTQELKKFQVMRFAIDSGDETMKETLEELASNVDEVANFNTVLYTELSENMEYQSSRFLEKELTEYLRLKSCFQTSDKAHDEAAAKMARISKKKLNKKTWQEATDQLYAARKTFHNTYMLYCCCLNDLQSKKKIGVLRPVINYLHSQIGFFKMGDEIGKKDIQDVLSKLTADLSLIESETAETRQITIEEMDRLDAQSTRAYIPDPPLSMDFPDLPVDTARTQISGYLFCRSKSTLLTQWHRNYFFTQGGNLMRQLKEELAGQLFLDLDGSTVSSADVDDRRNVFQITSANGRRTVVLQGESKQQCGEWIATIHNISAGLYLADDPRQAVMDALKSKELSEHTITSTTTTTLEQPDISDQKSRTSDNLNDVPSEHDDNDKQPTSFEAKHNSFRPSMFERLKQAASSLITSDDRASKGEAIDSSSSSNIVVSSGSGSGDLPNSSGNGDSDFEMILDSKEPVLFDLPAVDLHKLTNVTKTQVGEMEDTHLTPKDSNSTHDAVELSNDDSSTFNAMFVVRFLGYKHINPDEDFSSKISHTIWQVMAARVMHKIFHRNELHLVVSDKTVLLKDPTTGLPKAGFPVSSIQQTKVHGDNPHLLGLVVYHDDTKDLRCYTFESNVDGNDVCCAITTALVLEQSKLELEQNTKQRQIETDLEEQSKIMALASASSQEEDLPDASLPDESSEKIEVADEHR